MMRLNKLCKIIFSMICITLFLGSFVPFQGKAADLLTTGKVKEQSKPDLFISSYSITDDIVESGSSFDLTIELKNTSEYVDIYNLLITLTSESNLIYPAYGESNQLFFDTMKAGETKIITIPCMAAQNINKAAVAISIYMRYGSEVAESLSNSASIYVPIKQDCEMAITGIDIPEETYVGMKSSMNVSYENVGSINIVEAKLQIEGNISDEQKVYDLAYMVAGAKSFSDLALTFQKTGEQTIRLKLVYTGADGNKYSSDGGTYTVNVVSVYNKDGITVDLGDISEASGDTLKEQWIILAVIAGAVLISGLIVLLIKRKKR